MKIAMLSPVSRRTPPRDSDYGPREQVVSLLTEQLVSMGQEVTLFATGDSITRGKLVWVCEHPCSEDAPVNADAWECLHYAEAFRRAGKFDVLHNHADYLPLTYSGFSHTPVVTTLHHPPTPSILPVYKKFNSRSYYVAISEAGRTADLDYIATVHHGINLDEFDYCTEAEDYLLYFGPINSHTGADKAITVAQQAALRLVIAGDVQDEAYFTSLVEPHIDGTSITFTGMPGKEERLRLMGRARGLLHLVGPDEPFSFSVLESLATGTPVIAFPRGAAPEIIKNGITGFIVTDIDAAVKAVKQLDTVDRMHCRAEVEQGFTSLHMAQNYLKVYQEILDQRENHRPWGYYDDLRESRDHKIKEIVVNPGERLSLQKHRHRAEHWIVVRGEALVTVGKHETLLKPGQSVDVPKGSIHRITNPANSSLLLVEVQMGDYFGEDDIIRLQDDYDR